MHGKKKGCVGGTAVREAVAAWRKAYDDGMDLLVKSLSVPHMLECHWGEPTGRAGTVDVFRTPDGVWKRTGRGFSSVNGRLSRRDSGVMVSRKSVFSGATAGGVSSRVSSPVYICSSGVWAFGRMYFTEPFSWLERFSSHEFVEPECAKNVMERRLKAFRDTALVSRARAGELCWVVYRIRKLGGWTPELFLPSELVEGIEREAGTGRFHDEKTLAATLGLGTEVSP